MPLILSFLLRTFLVLAGLVVAASLVVVCVLLLALWSLRAFWGRLTGRPVRPFAMRFGPRAGFEEMMRRARPASRTPRADATAGPRPRARGLEATDVVAREPRA